MSNYKVIAEFELEGATQAVDSVVELSEEVATPLLQEGKVSLIVADDQNDSNSEDQSNAA